MNYEIDINYFRVNDAETQGTDPQNKDETLSQTLSLETD